MNSEVRGFVSPGRLYEDFRHSKHKESEEVETSLALVFPYKGGSRHLSRSHIPESELFALGRRTDWTKSNSSFLLHTSEL